MEPIKERDMRGFLTLAAALVAGSLIYGVGTESVSAGPLPALTAPSADATAVTTAGWRDRYYRRNGVWPRGPGPYVDRDVVVTLDDDDDFVVIVPLRPASCGQYRYWNGVACVDARYNDPYLGPK
jgi:hypothetical protein